MQNAQRLIDLQRRVLLAEMDLSQRVDWSARSHAAPTVSGVRFFPESGSAPSAPLDTGSGKVGPGSGIAGGARLLLIADEEHPVQQGSQRARSARQLFVDSGVRAITRRIRAIWPAEVDEMRAIRVREAPQAARERAPDLQRHVGRKVVLCADDHNLNAGLRDLTVPLSLGSRSGGGRDLGCPRLHCSSVAGSGEVSARCATLLDARLPAEILTPS